jgi:Domain of unknown function (DUF4252)
MKSIIFGAGKLIFFSALLLVCAASAAFAQGARLQLDSLDRFESVADQTVDVTVDQKVLHLAKLFLSKSRNTNEQKIKELISEVEGIYVKHFTFEKAGQFSAADLEPIRSQLNNPAWIKIANVRSRRKGQNIDVYTQVNGNKVGGLAVFATEDRELTVVNIVGPIDLEKLSELEGSFGIPGFQIQRDKDDKSQKE